MNQNVSKRAYIAYWIIIYKPALPCPITVVHIVFTLLYIQLKQLSINGQFFTGTS